MSRLTATELYQRLAADVTAAEAAALGARLRETLGDEALRAGTATLVDELLVGWAVEAPAARAVPEIVTEVGDAVATPMSCLGDTGLYVAAARLPVGTALRWRYRLDGQPLGGGQLEVYPSHPESQARPEVPTGVVEAQPRWVSSVFAGTARAWSLYVPAQYTPATPAAVMIFQDGVRFYQSMVPTVFDNLIAAGAMPVTIGIFLDPGLFADTTVSNRSFEYDTLSDQYARFLLEEILPAVATRYTLRQDAAGRAICGMSSGGICAFTAAWQRPDQFGKVLSHVGSFANIAAGPSLRDGGHNYPFLIRKMPPKPIRVYLQAGENDLNNIHGNWWLANLQMADALKFASYDYHLVTGRGFHSLAHGRAILPDSLRWLWRGESPLGGS